MTPVDLTDSRGRVWRWNEHRGRYHHDNDLETFLWRRTTIEDEAGPVTAMTKPPPRIGVDSVFPTRSMSGVVTFETRYGSRRRGPTIPDVMDRAEAAIRQREATPGQPGGGPYPATVGEVADELAKFITELDATCARGLVTELVERLTRAAQ